MNGAPDRLTSDKIQQLLAALRKDEAPAELNIEATEYDWHQPHYFDSGQFQRLEKFANDVAFAVAGRFNQFFQCGFSVEVNSITQHYAGRFVSRILEGDQNNYYLLLQSRQNVACGLIIVPFQTALDWLVLLLGEHEPQEESQQGLSELEKSLLSDIACSLAEAIFKSEQAFKLRITNSAISEHFSLDIPNCAELIQITFELCQDGTEQKHQAHLIAPCGELLEITGAQRHEAVSPQQTQNAIFEHLKQLPVVVTAKLASTELAFAQILTLQKNDVLLLDKKISEPVELMVEGRGRFLGQLAKSGLELAMVITKASCHSEQRSN